MRNLKNQFNLLNPPRNGVVVFILRLTLELGVANPRADDWEDLEDLKDLFCHLANSSYLRTHFQAYALGDFHFEYKYTQ